MNYSSESEQTPRTVAQERWIACLRAMGADVETHTGRSLLDHLVAVHDILAAWDMGDELLAAAHFHSAYGTETFSTALWSIDRREDLRGVIGSPAERFVYLYCAVPPTALAAVIGDEASVTVIDRFNGNPVSLDREDVESLCRLHVADCVEQRLVPAIRGSSAYPFRRMAAFLGGVPLAAFDRFQRRPRRRFARARDFGVRVLRWDQTRNP